MKLSNLFDFSPHQPTAKYWRAAVYYGVRTLFYIGSRLLIYALYRYLKTTALAAGFEYAALVVWKVSWGWGQSLALFACRKLGLSLEAENTHTISTNIAAIQFETRKPYVIERRFEAIIVPFAFTLGALFMGLALFSTKTVNRPGIVIVAVLFVLCFIAAILSFRNIKRPWFRIDDGGIDICSWGGVFCRHLHWGEVSDITVHKRLNVFGTVEGEDIEIYDSTQRLITQFSIFSGSEAAASDTGQSLANYLSLRFTGKECEPRTSPVEPLLPPRAASFLSNQNNDLPLLLRSDAEAVWLILPLWFRLVVSLGMVFMSGLFLLGIGESSIGSEKQLMAALACIMGLITILLIPLLNLNSVRVRADGQGVTIPKGFWNTRSLIPWHRIAFAGYEEKYNQYHNTVSKSLILKDGGGNLLCSYPVGGLKAEDSQQLIDFLHRKISVLGQPGSLQHFPPTARTS